MTRFSIMRIDPLHVEEICDDIREQIQKDVSDCPLFMVKLQPEGDPLIDKAALAQGELAPFVTRLSEMGLPFGILVQSTIGHGYALEKDPDLSRVVALDDGDVKHICCPSGEKFREYIRGQMAELAALHPRVILVDDDLRLMYHFARGCACPWHMKRFHELSGTNLSREELRAAVAAGGEEGDRLFEVFAETQRESLLMTARAIREGLDRVDPHLWAGFCSSIAIEFSGEIADVLAGEGNPRLVRLNTPNYCGGGREISRLSYRAAYGANALSAPGAVLLAETDTCPQMRYATSASTMHATYTVDLLEGAAGAKHWLTKLDNYVPQTGVAYRRILAKYAGFYRELARVVPTLTWEGCRVPLPEKHRYTFAHTGFYEDFSGWSCKCLERLGFPVYFSAAPGGVSFLDGGIPGNLSDDELTACLRSACVLTSEAAETLIGRGFGDLIGVSVRDYDGFIGYEKIGNGRCGVQLRAKELVPADGAVVDSENRVSDGTGDRYLCPGCVTFRNRLGGTVITFAGTPTYEWFHYTQAFSFLNPVRKEQLRRLLAPLGGCRVFYPDDAEVYVKTATTPDGETFVSLLNIGMDTEEEIVLSSAVPVSGVRYLAPDGAWREAEFRTAGDRLTVSLPLVPLHAAILLLR